MGEKTGIEWTNLTWNPWQGCTKVSSGCKHCYMFTEKYRYGQDPTKVVRSAPATFNLPKSIKRCPPGSLVFTCSWSDWFHVDADPWRPEAWEIVRSRPDVTFQVLTKRHDRILANLPAWWGDGPDNVWLGVSVENQAAADLRVPWLADVPARTRFLSMEPVLGPIENIPAIEKLHWVISGGESGPNARISHPDWHRSIRDQCEKAGVPFLFKQWGEWRPTAPNAAPRTFVCPDGMTLEGVLSGELPEGAIGMSRPGKSAAGRELDGRLHDGYPPIRHTIAAAADVGSLL